MTEQTYFTKKTDIKTNWHHLDAKEEVLGHLATRIVTLLTGKHKVNYVPYLNCGDKVVITNAEKIKVTGNKELAKHYYSHNQRKRGFREETLEHLRDRNPSKILMLAIKGMLPKNKLRKVRLANLYIYAGDENPHTAQTNVKK